jgi:hypothetical protein
MKHFYMMLDHDKSNVGIALSVNSRAAILDDRKTNM